MKLQLITLLSHDRLMDGLPVGGSPGLVGYPAVVVAGKYTDYRLYSLATHRSGVPVAFGIIFTLMRVIFQ